MELKIFYKLQKARNTKILYFTFKVDFTRMTKQSLLVSVRKTSCHSRQALELR